MNLKNNNFYKNSINIESQILNLIFQISNLEWAILASVLSLIMTPYYMRKTSIVLESIHTKERRFRELFIFFLFSFNTYKFIM